MDATVEDAEEARLLALEALNVMGTPPEDRFDRVTRLCTRLFDVPMAAVALVSSDRSQLLGGPVDIGRSTVAPAVTLADAHPRRRSGSRRAGL